MVISPTFDFSGRFRRRDHHARVLSRPKRRLPERVRAILSACPRDIRVPGHKIQRLSAQQSRHYGHLALNGKTLRPICIDARGALRQLWQSAPAPVGLPPSSTVISILRLRFNLPQPDVSLNRAAPTRPWIERAQSSLVTSFANGVAKDKSAIGAAITSHWSNGQPKPDHQAQTRETADVWTRENRPARSSPDRSWMTCTKYASEPKLHAETHNRAPRNQILYP